MSNFILNHLSPSTINSFLQNKLKFATKITSKVEFIPNPKMQLGKAVEEGINQSLLGMPLEACYEAARQEYLKEFPLETAPGPIEQLVSLAAGHYLNYHSFDPWESQSKITVSIEGIKLPIIGFTDYKNRSQWRDTKVSGKTPSKLSQNYLLQGTVYRLATGLPGGFDFFVYLKSGVKHTYLPLTDEDYAFGLSYLKATCQAIEKLMEETDPLEIIKLMAFPDLESIWDEGERKEVMNLYGI